MRQRHRPLAIAATIIGATLTLSGQPVVAETTAPSAAPGTAMEATTQITVDKPTVIDTTVQPGTYRSAQSVPPAPSQPTPSTHWTSRDSEPRTSRDDTTAVGRPLLRRAQRGHLLRPPAGYAWCRRAQPFRRGHQRHRYRHLRQGDRSTCPQHHAQRLLQVPEPADLPSTRRL